MQNRCSRPRVDASLASVALWTLTVLAALTSCAPVPSKPARVGNVTIDVTSRLEYSPFTQEELADPSTRAAIAWCERQGMTRCAESPRPGDSRSEFSRTKDEEVLVLIRLRDVEAGREYEVTARWFDPEGGLRAWVSKAMRTPDPLPPNFTSNSTLNMKLRDREIGRWHVEIIVNGLVLGARAFNVVE